METPQEWEKEESPRVIGHYYGEEPGPLVVVIGGIHGNEPAGVSALERLFELLAEEPELNPGFTFSGEVLALRGNLAALDAGVRYIDEDLNRIWRPYKRRPEDPYPSSEMRELDGLLAAIDHALEEASSRELILLDLHTTSAEGGIFAFTGDDRGSLMLAAEMGVPVVKGMAANLRGTTLSYFRGGHFGEDIRVRAISFEAGNHKDPVSVDRALAATVNLLRAVGCVKEADVSTHHDEALRQDGGSLPNLTELVYAHHLPRDRPHGFRMCPGYKNFQAVSQNEILAEDADGPIASPCDGYILMPLYQEKGEEGFFIVSDYRPPVAY